jgi:hypothetical protein
VHGPGTLNAPGRFPRFGPSLGTVSAVWPSGDFLTSVDPTDRSQVDPRRQCPAPYRIVRMRGFALNIPSNAELQNCRCAMPRNLADVQRELHETLREIRHAKDRKAALRLVEKLRRLLREAESLRDAAA